MDNICFLVSIRQRICQSGVPVNIDRTFTNVSNNTTFDLLNGYTVTISRISNCRIRLTFVNDTFDFRFSFDVDDSTILNFRNSPIDKMEKLIENNIPVLLLYGNADPVVIYRENGKVLEDYYKVNGGNIKVICRTMAKHHPHGLENPEPIIRFVEDNL